MFLEVANLFLVSYGLQLTTELSCCNDELFLDVQEKQLVRVRQENEVLKNDVSNLKSQHDASVLEVSTMYDYIRTLS